jgi:regulator of protease activity HflC (stomatin/prohibitin superfamily)
VGKVMVLEWERAVRFRDGVLVGELGAGRHKLGRHEEARVVDTRPTTITVSSQDVPTADGVLVRLGLAVRWSVKNASTYVRSAAIPADELYLAAQLGLRTAVLSRAHDAVDAQRAEIAEETKASMAERAVELGAEVLTVALRDVVMPAELRRAMLSELVARREGQAALERARGEAAAMRTLLNAAKLVEEHPALLQLRTLQAAAQPGATVVFERPR